MPCHRKQGLSGGGQTYICANGIMSGNVSSVDAHGVEKGFNSHSLSVHNYAVCTTYIVRTLRSYKANFKKTAFFHLPCLSQGGKGQLQGEKRRASENRSLPPSFPSRRRQKCPFSSFFAILLFSLPADSFCGCPFSHPPIPPRPN